jgi:hypothetical protein
MHQGSECHHRRMYIDIRNKSESCSMFNAEPRTKRWFVKSESSATIRRNPPIDDNHGEQLAVCGIEAFEDSLKPQLLSCCLECLHARMYACHLYMCLFMFYVSMYAHLLACIHGSLYVCRNAYAVSHTYSHACEL